MSRTIAGAKEEAEDLDLEWEEVTNGKIPATPTGSVTPRSGKMSPKKKMAQPVQQLPQTFPEANFDPESSNSASFVNVGPGFSPFATPLKRDDVSYDWVRFKRLFSLVVILAAFLMTFGSAWRSIRFVKCCHVTSVNQSDYFVFD